MMYLAGQIVLSLLAAGLLGGIAGWMLRGDLERRALVAARNTLPGQQP